MSEETEEVRGEAKEKRGTAILVPIRISEKMVSLVLSLLFLHD
jgi:hypothetical protein